MAYCTKLNIITLHGESSNGLLFFKSKSVSSQSIFRALTTMSSLTRVAQLSIDPQLGSLLLFWCCFSEWCCDVLLGWEIHVDVLGELIAVIIQCALKVHAQATIYTSCMQLFSKLQVSTHACRSTMWQFEQQQQQQQQQRQQPQQRQPHFIV